MSNYCDYEDVGYVVLRIEEMDLWFDTVLRRYDLDRFVVRPATKPFQCSVVELMAEGEQPPDYFVSHFWGHSIISTLACLEVHSSALARVHRFHLYF